MLQKRFCLLSLFVLLIIVCTTGLMLAEEREGKFIDPNVPESWYHAPKLASELGVSEFNQSPMLDSKVDKGSLPPVEDRLPDDPPVIEPYDTIGEYGGLVEGYGTHIRIWRGANRALQRKGIHKLGRAVPDGSKIVPYLAAGWESSEDKKTWTIHLRKGIKWSDGHPWTADDFIYWWKYEAQNEDLNPVPPEKWELPLLNVEKIDDYTVKFHFGKGDPLFENDLHRYFVRTYGGLEPAHYLKQFHPAFRDEEELMKEVEEAGFSTWTELYEDKRGDLFEGPSLLPYVAVEKTKDYVIGERNPYYPFVDTEGNQLPYIDKIRTNLVTKDEIVKMKLISGDMPFGYRTPMLDDLPMLRKNEEKGDYEVNMYYKPNGADLAILPNLNHHDQQYRKIMNDARFRQAISLSIDRKEINKRVYFGEAKPGAAGPIESSKFWHPAMEKYVERDLDKARSLLDEIGIKDIDGDGFRELPNGDDLVLEWMYVEVWCPATAISELIKSHLEDVGLKFKLNLVNYSLNVERRSSGDYDLRMNNLGNALDLSFPLYSGLYIPNEFMTHDGHSAEIEWYRYWTTDGDKGKKPPEEIQKLRKIAHTLRYDPDEKKRIEAGRKLTKSIGEKVWRIGTVKMIPKPIVVSNKLHNVPKTGLYTDDLQRMDITYPIQYWLEE